MWPFACSLTWANMAITDEFVRAQFNDILYLLLIFFCYWLFISFTFACYIFNELTYTKNKIRKKMESAQISMNGWTDQSERGTNI